MKILDRYLIRGFLFTFFLSIAGVCLLVIFVDLVGNLGKFIDKSVEGKIIVRYYLAYIPFIISQALPMAMLFGGMFSLSQKARNNELVVMKTTGISVTRIISPLMLVSLLLSVGAFEFNETIVPGQSTEIRYRNGIHWSRAVNEREASGECFLDDCEQPHDFYRPLRFTD